MVRSDEKGPLSITRHYNTPSKKVLDLFFGPRTDKSRNKILAFFAPPHPNRISDFRLAT